jgi:preprotein translocase subunit YajC
MDFIERIFGFAPDGGSGSLEFLLFALTIAGIAYLIVYRRQRRKK